MAKGKYQQWLEPDSLLLLKSWARDGLNDKEIADKIGVSRDTLYDWEKRFSDISDTIKKGRRPVEVEVEDSFIKQLMGYYVDEEMTEITKDGSGNVISQHVRKTKRYISPNPTLLIFYLKTRMSNKYKENKSVDLRVNEETTNIIKSLKAGVIENDE